jgi:uncharacterized protein (TIGR03435 family)
MKMRSLTFRLATASLLLVTGAAWAQNAPRPSFEVASVKPAAPIDMQKVAQQMMSGGEMPKIGPHVDGAQAEYTFMALRDLMVVAYKVKQYQITGPDWIVNTRFDIKAKMPAGSTKDDAPLMLQSLLEERFKLSVRRETKEHPVLALVVGKNGLKMKESEAPKAIDDNAPLQPGVTRMETADGPMLMKVDPKSMTSNIDMGVKGKFETKVDPSTMTMHMQATQVTMQGFVDMLNQFSNMGGAGSARTIVDMTDLKGHYEVAIDFSLADLIAMIRASGVDVPGGGPGAGSPSGAASASGGAAASTPGGGTSITDAVQALGLKLESRKAPVEQLIIDHIEKTPVEN